MCRVTSLHSDLVLFSHTYSHYVNEKKLLVSVLFLWINSSNDFSCDFQ